MSVAAHLSADKSYTSPCKHGNKCNPHYSLYLSYIKNSLCYNILTITSINFQDYVPKSLCAFDELSYHQLFLADFKINYFLRYQRLIDYPEILGVKLYFRFRLKERTVCVCELDKI